MDEVGEQGGDGDAEDEDGGGRGADVRCAGVVRGGEPVDGGVAESEDVHGVEGDADDEGLQDATRDVGVVGAASADGGPDGDPDDAWQDEDDQGEHAEGVGRDVHRRLLPVCSAD